MKPTLLANCGHTVLNPKLPDEDFDEAVEIDILTRDWTGLCYTAALEWARDAEEDRDIVHGKVLFTQGSLPTTKPPETGHIS